MEYKNPLVSLYGSNFIKNDWTIPCMVSWRKILNISSDEFYILPDKAINNEEEIFFSKMNFNVLGLSSNETVEEFLKDYPALDSIRAKDVSWKKVLDAVILFQEAEKITIIDTDVFIKENVLLPINNFDIAYMREDVPAYRGRWDMVWREKMVPALNAGLIMVDPRVVDFNYLEWLVSKYLIDCKHFWWTEQSAWSCIAGKSEKRFVFSGEQVKVISGCKKRSALEISNNSFKYFGKKGMISNKEEFESLFLNGSILHFAGPGKYTFFKECENALSSHTESNPIQITGEYEDTLSIFDKIFISLRLFLKELR